MVHKKHSLCEKTDGFLQSPYFMSATGCRVVSRPELIEIFKIITCGCEAISIKQKLEVLYKYREETIAMDKAQQASSCSQFNADVCDCFLPDVDFDNCYCSRKRREFLKNTDYRNTKEYSAWRLLVFERDEFKCQDCGKVGGELNAHHIKTFKQFPEHRYDIDNGVSLCVKCHRLRHKK